MPFPVNLSVSPVSEAFPSIQWDPLDLSEPEKALLQAGEQNVLDYTLYDQEGAAAYSHLLLKVLDELISPRAPPSRQATQLRVTKLPLDSALSFDDALQHLDCDFAGVATHYAVSRLCEVVVALRDAATSTTGNSSSSSAGRSKKSKATVSTTFFPSGLLVDDWRPLLRILLGERSDVFAQRGAAYCLGVILIEGCQLQRQGLLFQPLDPILESFVSCMTSRLQASITSKSLAVVTPSLVVLIMSEQARELFAGAGGIGYLGRQLRSDDEESASSSNTESAVAVKNGPSSQQSYELVYCLWVMSYDCFDNSNRRHHFHRNGAVRSLVDLVSGKPREKISRCGLSALVNLATCEGGKELFHADMIGCGLIKSIELMRQRQISDPDITNDMDVLHRLLKKTCSELNRWDVYQAELDSGSLTWGVVHAEEFFRNNIRRMEGRLGDFAPVKRLIQLIQIHTRHIITSSNSDRANASRNKEDDEAVAAIACFDLGEFIRLYPNGKLVARRLGAREVILPLIDRPHHHDDEHDSNKSNADQLQMQAVTCLSKMLVQNWAAAVAR